MAKCLSTLFIVQPLLLVLLYIKYVELNFFHQDYSLKFKYFKLLKNSPYHVLAIMLVGTIYLFHQVIKGLVNRLLISIVRKFFN